MKRRRSRAGHKPIKARPRKAATRKRRNASKAVRRSPPAGQNSEIARLTRELQEAREQQAATSEVLHVISSSPGDLELAFQTMLDNAVRICGAKFGALSLREGNAFRSIAMTGVLPAFAERRRQDPLIQPTPGHNLERLVRTKRIVHVPDLAADKDAGRELFEFAGARALLNVPLLKDNELIGSILLYRDESGPARRQTDQSWSRTSPLRPSSPSRMRGCSKNYTSAPTI